VSVAGLLRDSSSLNTLRHARGSSSNPARRNSHSYLYLPFIPAALPSALVISKRRREKCARVQTQRGLNKTIKRFLVFLITSIFLAAPMRMAQDSDHVEVGALVDFFRLSNNAAPVSNFLGVGGGPAFNVNLDV